VISVYIPLALLERRCAGAYRQCALQELSKKATLSPATTIEVEAEFG
jgi:hypothetical protein